MWATTNVNFTRKASPMDYGLGNQGVVTGSSAQTDIIPPQHLMGSLSILSE
jgi:hypothetical protein